MTSLKALFSASVILFVEKVFLQFVAINFHQKALADRLAANRLGLRALDRLSNAHTQKALYVKRGHKAPSPVGFFDFAPGTYPPHKVGDSTPEEYLAQPSKMPKRKKKLMTSVIVDQVHTVRTHDPTSLTKVGWRCDWTNNVEKFEIS